MSDPYEFDDGDEPRRRRARRVRAPARYERRIVVFIDFLGFRSLVQRSTEEEGLLDRMLSAMDAVGRIAADNVSASQRITQFSDSIVVSYKADETSAAFWLVNEIAFCVIELAERGFLLRGAVTVGQLFHDEDHVVGPAMVRAYELESTAAVNPRVIFDPAILRAARFHARDHSPREEEDHVRGYLARDYDGQLFFDYISWHSVVMITGVDDARYPDYLRKLGDLIARGLRQTEPSVLRKYLWLHGRYIAALGLFDGPRANYLRDHPDRVEAVRRLPRHIRMANVARRRAGYD